MQKYVPEETGQAEAHCSRCRRTKIVDKDSGQNSEKSHYRSVINRKMDRVETTHISNLTRDSAPDSVPQIW